MRVLSLQSHVVHGYVGNKSATFPLQLLGFDVDAVNTVQFSNHSGYPAVRGERLQGEHLEQLIEGLAANGLLGGYTHVLTGYIGSGSFVRILAALVRRLRAVRPGLVYVCDPVLGDHDQAYVPAEVVELMRTELVPLADVLTPNQFELETLTGRKVASDADALAAIDALHAQSAAACVLLTSTDYDRERLSVIGSQRAGRGG